MATQQTFLQVSQSGCMNLIDGHVSLQSSKIINKYEGETFDYEQMKDYSSKLTERLFYLFEHPQLRKKVSESVADLFGFYLFEKRWTSRRHLQVCLTNMRVAKGGYQSRITLNF